MFLLERGHNFLTRNIILPRRNNPLKNILRKILLSNGSIRKPWGNSRFLFDGNYSPLIRFLFLLGDEFLLPIRTTVAPQEEFHMKIFADKVLEGIDEQADLFIANQEWETVVSKKGDHEAKRSATMTRLQSNSHRFRREMKVKTDKVHHQDKRIATKMTREMHKATEEIENLRTQRFAKIEIPAPKGGKEWSLPPWELPERRNKLTGGRRHQPMNFSRTSSHPSIGVKHHVTCNNHSLYRG